MAGADDVVAALARERWRALVGYGYVLSGSMAEAEDLAQEALVRTVVRARDGVDLESAEAYVRRAMTTLYLDRGRRTTRWGRVRHLVAVEDGRPGGAATSPDPAVVTAAQDSVRDALATLSPRERACVVLRHLEDLSVTETAEVLGVSTGAVKRYTSEGLSRLQTRLGPLTGTDVETSHVERRAGR